MILRREQPCRIAGTGVALPVLPDGTGPIGNREVVERHAAIGRRGRRSREDLDELAAGLGDMLGVRQRHWAHPIGQPFSEDEDTSADLQVRAIAAALERAGMEAGELAAVIAATSTPARVTGANAPAVASRIGAQGAAAFDIRSGCAGGLLALAHGCLLAAQTGAPVAVTGGDTFSKIAPPGVPLAAMAFGDGAGAAIVVPGEAGAGLRSAAFSADGDLGGLASAPAPFPITREALDAGRYFIQGSPEELGERAPGLVARAVRLALEAAGIGAADIDVFVPHQTSRPAIEKLADAAGIPRERTVITADDHGNCGAAGVFFALDRARETGRLGAGKSVLLAALGGGLSWGAAVFRPPIE